MNVVFSCDKYFMLVNGTTNISSNEWGEGGAKMELIPGSKE